MAEQLDDHLTTDEVAAKLGVCKRTVETLMSTGELSYVKVRRSVRIPSRAVNSYLEGATRHPEPDRSAPVRTARASARKTIHH